MKRNIVLGLAALLAFSCAKNDSAVISARIEGAASKDIMVSQLVMNQIRLVDTVKAGNGGEFRYEVAMTDKSPNFYYLSYGGTKLASLILQPGDKVSVTVDTLGQGLDIKGSEESLVLQQYDEEFAAALGKFHEYSNKLNAALESGDKAGADANSKALGSLYVKYKQAVIKNIMKHPYSFANITALYQHFLPQLPVFAQSNDIFFVKRVHDSLYTKYPNSMYVKSLDNLVQSADEVNSFNERLSDAKMASFPNISLPDIHAKKVELASLEGKPFMLMFWTTTDPKQKMLNNELKTVYAKYKSAGFEIYQVCVDIDKTAWASTVKDQELPWISVCDGNGNASPAVITYNITSIPSNFVFAKDGEIVAKDVFTKAKLEAAIQKAVR